MRTPLLLYILSLRCKFLTDVKSRFALRKDKLAAAYFFENFSKQTNKQCKEKVTNKLLQGLAQDFHTDVKDGRSFFIEQWFVLKCFMGRWCCLPGGGTPLNCNTVSFYISLFLKSDHEKKSNLH